MLEFNVDTYRCVATEACRQVINSDLFISKVKNKTGLTIEIISAEEEAKLCFVSCKKYLDKMNNQGVLFDIGGGSTEFSIFDTEKEFFLTRSIPIGVINFSEKVSLFGEKNVLLELDKHFKYLKNNFLNTIDLSFSLGSCSTISTLSAISQNLKFFNRKKIEGSFLDVKKILQLIEDLKVFDVNQMMNHPCIQNRYPLLISGMEILNKILLNFPIKKIIVSQGGLTEGIIENLS